MEMIDLNATDLVIFDCDGVLVDSEPLANEVLASHATTLGWSMDQEISQKLFKGMTMAQIHHRFEERLERTLSRDWIELYYTDCFALFKKRLKPISGVGDLIARVKSAGKRVCVASQGPHNKMRLTLGVTGLWDHFDGRIFSAHDVARPKPYPDLFLHAAQKMGVTPEYCCVIEDSQTGLKAARAAKMPVIYYASEMLAAEQAQFPVGEVALHMDEIFPHRT